MTEDIEEGFEYHVGTLDGNVFVARLGRDEQGLFWNKNKMEVIPISAEEMIRTATELLVELGEYRIYESVKTGKKYYIQAVDLSEETDLQRCNRVRAKGILCPGVCNQCKIENCTDRVKEYLKAYTGDFDD